MRENLIFPPPFKGEGKGEGNYYSNSANFIAISVTRIA